MRKQAEQTLTTLLAERGGDGPPTSAGVWLVAIKWGPDSTEIDIVDVFQDHDGLRVVQVDGLECNEVWPSDPLDRLPVARSMLIAAHPS